MTQQGLPFINFTRCDLCGKCVAGCPEDALIMTDDGPAFKQPLTCTYCTDCEALCPLGAIRAPMKVTWGREH